MKSRTVGNGFTLVELLIVIVVIAVLVGISIVAYKGISTRAQNSSLLSDLQEMDVAQKRYMAETDQGPIAYTPTEGSNILFFESNKGNSLLVKLLPDKQYCIYGFNPNSSYPTKDKPMIRASVNTSLCTTVTATEIANATQSTVAIVGQRLEQFYAKENHYPDISELIAIGLVVKPNSSKANQQQLYCRNDSPKAVYLQKDKTTNVIYAYQTSSKSISSPTTLSKTSLESACPTFQISPSDPGFGSSGIKDPNF